MKIGAQLYSLRDYCKTLDDFKETLKKVADMGYTSVQVSGTCAYEADWLADALKETGLTCDLTHYSLDKEALGGVIAALSQLQSAVRKPCDGPFYGCPESEYLRCRAYVPPELRGKEQDTNV